MPIDIHGACPLLQVYDMPTSIRFYRDILGFIIAGNAPVRAPDEFGWCLLRHVDGTEIMLNTAYDYGERPETPDPAHIAAHRDICIYFGCPDVDAAWRHLRDKGLDIPEREFSTA